MGLITIFADVLGYALKLLPSVGTSLDSFSATAQNVFAQVYVINGYFPIDVLVLCLGILWAAHSLEFVGDLILKLYDKIPFKGA